jgi:drug/metabolite transporter (DMT)-like permease
MTAARTWTLTALAMSAFAGNSLLCRMALRHTQIDAAGFTLVRIVSGAVTLWLIVVLGRGSRGVAGDWGSAAALFAYAAAFSFAYVGLTAGAGALLLFGAVQATMIGAGFVGGERLSPKQTAGLVLALAGLAGMLLPGLSAPSLWHSVLMLAAGVAWGVYSLRGKGVADPAAATAGNFVRAVPMAVVLGVAALPTLQWDAAGVGYAVASGALASGIGYAIWYSALRGLTAIRAATVQLSVPVLAAVAGIGLLGESMTLRLVAAAIAILGGIALVMTGRKQA